MRAPVAAVLLAVLLATGAVAAGPAAAADAKGLCARFGSGSVAGTVTDDGLVEASGLAASRAHPGVLWAHNDSGGEPEVHALSADGEAMGTYTVAGAEAVDWEDMAVDRSHLYLADTGDNRASRPFVTVYRVPEPTRAPDGTGGALTETQVLRLRYPDGPADAEALLVDPRSGDLVLLTKELGGAFSRVFRAPAASLRDGADVSLEAAGRFDVPLPGRFVIGLPAWLVTGADVSPDGSIVLVRTYRSVLAFERRTGEPLADAFTRPPCQAPQAEEAQGEAVAFAADGRSYFTLGEGAGVPLHRFAVAAAEGSTADAPADDAAPVTEGGGGWVSRSLAGVGVLLAVVVLMASGRGRAGRRRRRGSRRP